MPNTALQAFPYPALTDPANGPVAFQNLAQALENKTVYDVLSTARPPHREGRLIYETDTDRIYVSDGAAWQLVWEKVPSLVGSVQRAYKVNNQVVNNNATLVNDTALFFQGAVNSVYMVDVMLLFLTAGGGTSSMDAKVGFGVPAGGSWSGGIIGPEVAIASTSTVAAGEWNALVGAAGSGLVVGVSNAGTTHSRFQSVVQLGATAGTITLRWAQNTAAAFDLTLSRSWLRAERIS